MEDILKMDIFFAVATIALVLIAGLIVVALVYAIWFLRTLGRIAGDVEGEAKALIHDIDGVRQKVRIEGFKTAHVISLIGGMGKRFLSKSRRK